MLFLFQEVCYLKLFIVKEILEEQLGIPNKDKMIEIILCQL